MRLIIPVAALALFLAFLASRAPHIRLVYGCTIEQQAPNGDCP